VFSGPHMAVEGVAAFSRFAPLCLPAHTHPTIHPPTPTHTHTHTDTHILTHMHTTHAHTNQHLDKDVDATGSARRDADRVLRKDPEDTSPP
jgi:hypothetical protein